MVTAAGPASAPRPAPTLVQPAPRTLETRCGPASGTNIHPCRKRPPHARRCPAPGRSRRTHHRLRGTAVDPSALPGAAGGSPDPTICRKSAAERCSRSGEHHRQLSAADRSSCAPERPAAHPTTLALPPSWSGVTDQPAGETVSEGTSCLAGRGRLTCTEPAFSVHRRSDRYSRLGHR